MLTFANNSQESPPSLPLSGTIHVFVIDPVEFLSSASGGRKGYRIGLLSTSIFP